jgi:sec-independent protein translocase protein TatB
VHRGSATGSAGLGVAGGAVVARDVGRPRDHATPPPFDPDAT